MGKENYLSTLKHAYGCMAGQAILTGHTELLKSYMENIRKKINNL